MAEQGYFEVPQALKVNDAIRRVNAEGWDVKQIVVRQSNHTASNTVLFGLLLERQQ